MKYGFFIAMFLLGFNSYASLSPYWDSATKIKTVVESKQLAAKVRGPITGLNQVEDLVFDVFTSKCVATVQLDAHFSDQPGPTEYSINSISKVYCEE